MVVTVTVQGTTEPLCCWLRPAPPNLNINLHCTYNQILDSTVPLLRGSYHVEETVPELPSNEINTESQSEDCAGTIAAGESKTCTVTNTVEFNEIG